MYVLFFCSEHNHSQQIKHWWQHLKKNIVREISSMCPCISDAIQPVTRAMHSYSFAKLKLLPCSFQLKSPKHVGWRGNWKLLCRDKWHAVNSIGGNQLLAQRSGLIAEGHPIRAEHIWSRLKESPPWLSGSSDLVTHRRLEMERAEGGQKARRRKDSRERGGRGKKGDEIAEGGGVKIKAQEGEGERGRTSGLAWISTGKIAGPAGDFLLCFFAGLPCGADGDSMCDEWGHPEVASKTLPETTEHILTVQMDSSVYISWATSHVDSKTLPSSRFKLQTPSWTFYVKVIKTKSSVCFSIGFYCINRETQEDKLWSGHLFMRKC